VADRVQEPRGRRRRDGLALRRAISDRLLPALVAAMAFLGALTLAGAVGASLLATRWQQGAASILTVQVPQPDAPAAGTSGGKRADAVEAALHGMGAVRSVRRLSSAELRALLRPWLGDAAADGVALPLPAVIQLRLGQDAVPDDMARALDAVAPGTLVEHNAGWTSRLLALTQSLQACAGLALLVVAGVAAAVVAAATRAGLGARREAIEIVHSLGATDSYIAGRFAQRATGLTLAGGIVGTVLSVPLLMALCRLAAPFAGPGAAAATPAWLLPLPLWIGLPLLPMLAAAIGWATAQVTVRAWLRRLP
jgi:cell division transport system permease protein